MPDLAARRARAEEGERDEPVHEAGALLVVLAEGHEGVPLRIEPRLQNAAGVTGAGERTHTPLVGHLVAALVAGDG